MLKIFLIFFLAFVRLSAETTYLNCDENALVWNCCEKNLKISIGTGIVLPSKNCRVKGNSSSVLYRPTSVGTSLFSLPGVIWKNRYQTGFELFANLGYSFKSYFRAEGEFLYQNFKRKLSGSYDWQEVNACTTELFARNEGNPIHHASSTTNIYALLSSIYFDYKSCAPLSLSLGAGLGVAWMNSHGTQRHNLLHIETLNPPLNLLSPTVEKGPKLAGTAFAWQFKTNLKYQFCDSFSIALQYRLFGTTCFYGSRSKITTNPKTVNQAVFTIPRNRIPGLLNNSIGVCLSVEF